jgi:hypothetical protein
MFTRKRLPPYVKDKWAWWKNVVARDPEELEEDEEEVTPNTGGLLRFLENEQLPGMCSDEKSSRIGCSSAPGIRQWLTSNRLELLSRYQSI